MITRQQIAGMALSYCGTPFLHQGRAPGLGLDCAGIPVCVARDLGVPVDDYREYRSYPNSRVLMERMRANFDEIDPLEANTGDIVVRGMGRRSLPKHMGVLTETGIVSVDDRSCVFHASPLPVTWVNGARFAFRIRGVT